MMDGEDLRKAIEALYGEYQAVEGPELILWYGGVETIPQEWMDAYIADLEE